VVLGPLKPWRALVEINDSPLAIRLSGLLERKRSAAAVGAEYLRHDTGDVSRSALLEAITSGHPEGREAMIAASPSELRELVFARVRRDFDEDLTVNLRGWIVSRTEARLCALTALTERAVLERSGQRPRW